MTHQNDTKSPPAHDEGWSKINFKAMHAQEHGQTTHHAAASPPLSQEDIAACKRQAASFKQHGIEASDAHCTTDGTVRIPKDQLKKPAPNQR